MKFEVTKDNDLEKLIRDMLKSNKGYCPCSIEKNEDTKCMCKDFRENVKQGEYCHCGLYKKIEE